MIERNFSIPEKSKEEYSNIDSEIAKNLEKIDFLKLKNLFLQKITALGLNPKEYRNKFVMKGEDFKNSGLIKSYFSQGEYDIKDNSIKLNKNRLKEFKKSDYVQLSDNKERDELDFVLYHIAHEETHALSFNGFETDSNVSSNISVTGRGGYTATEVELKYYVLPRVESTYKLFNEAVTERIAREIFAEYAQRELSREMLSYSSGLNKAVTVFDSMCNEICSKCKIEEDVLWKVIMRGYFASEDLSGDKMGRLFQNIFPEDFEKKLKKMNVQPKRDEIQNIVDTIEQSTWTDRDRERIHRWVMHIYHIMPISHEK